jgi:hypothetical protein
MPRLAVSRTWGIPLLLQLLILAGLLALLMAAVAPALRLRSVERRALIPTLVTGLGLRLALVLILAAVHPWNHGGGAVTSDEAAIAHIARTYQPGHGPSMPLLAGSLYTAWDYLAWAVYRFWASLTALRLVNVAIGTATIVPVYFLAREIKGARAGRIAAWLAAVLPAGVVWSALGLREPLVALLIINFVLAIVRLLTGLPNLRSVSQWCFVAVSSVVILFFTRAYMVPLLLALSLIAAVGASASRRSARPLLAPVIVSALFLCVAFGTPQGRALVANTSSLVSISGNSIYDPLSPCAHTGACLQSSISRQTYDTPAKVKAAAASIKSSIQSVAQKGVIRAFLIAVLDGRPVWRRQQYLFMLQPGVVVWWVLLPLVVAGGFGLLLAKDWPSITMLVAYCAAMIIFLAYSGEFVRQHFMMELVAIVLAAVAIASLPAWPKFVRRGVWASSGFLGLCAVGSVIVSLVHPS